MLKTEEKRERAEVEVRLEHDHGRLPVLFAEGQPLPTCDLEIECERNGYTLITTRFAPKREQPPIRGILITRQPIEEIPGLIWHFYGQEVEINFGSTFTDFRVLIGGREIGVIRAKVTVPPHRRPTVELVVGTLRDEGGELVRDGQGNPMRDIVVAGELEIDESLEH